MEKLTTKGRSLAEENRDDNVYIPQGIPMDVLIQALNKQADLPPLAKAFAPNFQDLLLNSVKRQAQ